jgi:hypothetical protein
MSTRSSLLGLVHRIHCDRCGERIEHSRHAFCHSCSSINFETIRLSELLSTWEQGKTGYTTCCLCRNTFQTPLTYDVCSTCSWHHPDYSHVWDISIPPQGTTWAKHCFRCNSVQVVHTPAHGGQPEFLYFQVGSSVSSDSPFTCPRPDEKKLADAVRSCRHEWIEVASTVKPANDAHRIRAELEGNPVTNALGLDEVLLDHTAFGETIFWCVRCGNFYKLSPNRYDILPPFGGYYLD